MASKYYIIDGKIKVPCVFSADAVKFGLNYQARPDDIFISTYPKSGTTWMQHIVYLILVKGVPPKNYQEFKAKSPFLEVSGADAITSFIRPGPIMTHFPEELMPQHPDAKYIIVARNPRDCVVSYFHHTKMIPGYKNEDGIFDDFFDFFVKGEIGYGNFFDHLFSWYKRRYDSNVFFVTYEEMKKDTKGVVLRLGKFLGDEYSDALNNEPDVLENVLKYSTVEYMKYINTALESRFAAPKSKSESSSRTKNVEDNQTKTDTNRPRKVEFVRKGIVGDWKNMFSEEQVKIMQQWAAESTKGSDVIQTLWPDLKPSLLPE